MDSEFPIVAQQEQLQIDNNNLVSSIKFENGLSSLKKFICFRKLKNRFFIYSSGFLIILLIVLIFKVNWALGFIDYLNSIKVNIITRQIVIEKHWLLYVLLSFSILILGFIFLINLINLQQLKIGIKTYKKNQNNRGIPFFAKQQYKKQTQKKYYVSWFCLTIYWLILITTIAYTLYSFYLLKKLDWKLLFNHNKTFYLFTLSLFIVIVLYQIWSLICIKYVKENLENTYATQFFTVDELQHIKRAANRIGKWTFIITIILTVIIISIFFIFFKVERRKLSDIAKLFTAFRK
ncbi:MSC_0882 family membrane protein [Mycoplasma putrefaciens]|uniref:Transmembrane protein n=1 Tax=Mycoplasma putrefaciens Mput9231 TaxID=1292033 RepID=M9WGZ4_9MOLU|nr:hypothetical protein [Mycoplasma putrefaciens]AGJ90725.1 Hypothetical protein, predicted transmembrane protein [Mycoplasma putrefaciens Mput9231]